MLNSFHGYREFLATANCKATVQVCRVAAHAITQHPMPAGHDSTKINSNLGDPTPCASMRSGPNNLPTSRRCDANLSHSILCSEPYRPLPRPGDLDPWSARLPLLLGKYRYRFHGHGHRLLPARRHRYRGSPPYRPRLCPTVSSGHANFYVTSRITAGPPQ